LGLRERVKTADSGRQVRKLRFGAGDRRDERMTSKMATPLSWENPLDRWLCGPFFRKVCLCWNCGQGAVRGFGCLRITSQPV